MSVTWVDGALTQPSVAHAKSVIAIARELRVHFPEDYLDVAIGHQGARPEPGDFDLPGGWTYGVEHLLHFEPDSFSNLLTRRFPVEEVLPPTVVPFAEASGSTLVCFDFGIDAEAPTVAFWSVDTGLVPLADSFTAFLDLLHD